MNRLRSRLLPLAIIALCSCTHGESDIASERTNGSNGVVTSRAVVAGFRLTPERQRSVSLALAVQGENRLLLSVTNDMDMALFADRNLLLHGIHGVPMIKLFVHDAEGQLLFTCGYFHDPAEAYEGVEVGPGESASFEISVDELKQRYCVDQASVSVHIVEPAGRDFRSFAKSNEVQVD